CDDDVVEPSNLNRLVGATHEDALSGTPKVEVARRVVLAINPRASITSYKDRWQNVARELRRCDVVFGCVDSFSERAQLEAECRRFLTPYIDLGMDVSKFENGYAIAGQVSLSISGLPCRSEEHTSELQSRGHLVCR